MKYVYPAVFKKEGDLYSISFPDISGAISQGKNLTDAMLMAEDALCLVLYNMECNKMTIPKPSDIRTIEHGVEDVVTLVKCDTDYYKRYYSNKSVKKTLTIPAWLNEEATAHNVNFSKVLQDALKAHLML